MCEFHSWNLLNELSSLGYFDIIFCRNMLMYLDETTRSRVLDAIARRLSPEGLLYLGRLGDGNRPDHYAGAIRTGARGLSTRRQAA